MKKLFSKSWMLAIPMVLFMVSCDDDDSNADAIIVTDSVVYDLGPVSDPNISGNATISSLSNGDVQIDLALTGTPAGGEHPAHIHMNTAAEGGAIAISLAPVDGDTGASTIIVNSFDDGSPVTYDQLLTYDGYINVHLSANDLSTLVAQGDIGQNDLTGTSKIYELGEKDVAGIEGQVTFSERINGEALATLDIENTIAGREHPAHIHNNTAAEGGSIAFTFTRVDGDTGMSVTNVSSLDDGTAFGYDDILIVDGYVNVHLGPGNDLATIVAQGDIGQNELTGTSKTYNLGEKDVTGISGEITFFERLNDEALAVIDIENTPPGGNHPAHIHMNDAATGGPIVVTFNNVDGSTGESETNVSSFNDGTALTYDGILTYDGYVNVHLGPGNDLATIVAQGNIGSNEGS